MPYKKLILFACLCLVAVTYSISTDKPRVTLAKKHVLINEDTLLPCGSNFNAGEKSINGPSLIKVNGTYRLYFANHHGRDIRLATSTNIFGPYEMYNHCNPKRNGVFDIKSSKNIANHIASPDVYEDNARLFMYIHGVNPGNRRQQTYKLISKDGYKFNEVEGVTYAPFYLRRFEINNKAYAFSNGGLFWEWRNSGWHQLYSPINFAKRYDSKKYRNTGNRFDDPRHLAVDTSELNTLHVYYSVRNDIQEKILRVTIENINESFVNWKIGEENVVAMPSEKWDCSDQKVSKSKTGVPQNNENAYRDPYIFNDDDGSKYLLFTYCGESGIGIVQL